ncbi:hypothetical protein AMECASPLE_017959 [Ameca splendens]|uniref:Peptidase M12B domain-containing protein n=1 Tax=Ameca splendens TaxID=208324 RepID=A0ABV0Y2S3_9TELE
MHVLLWGLGFLLFPDLLNVVASTGRLLRSSSTAPEELAVYEIVTPVRVNEAGDKLPAGVHFRRKRRSLDEGTGNTADHWAAANIHYRISAFGKNYHLNLTLDSGFIAPVYTVTILGAPRGDNGTAFATDAEREEEEEEEDTELRHCFYSGHVNAHAQHAAVISLCSGLFGTFRSPEGEYFVEPLQSYQGEHYEEEHTKPHIVYRKLSSGNHTSEETSACDTSGHKHRHKRQKARRRPASVTSVAPLVGAGMLHELGSLSASLAGSAWLRSEHAVASSRPSNDSSGDSGPHRRSKRFLSYPRFVEVMLVADSKMVEHHGSNLQHYILTLMSIVSSIYKDPSIGNLINIVIVKLVIINNELDGPAISFNAQTTLKNFCIWQQRQNILDDNHPSHHDTAILITRQDICRARDKCDTLGLAELGTVCDPYRSCSISEDNGLSTAFTIAHELGHVLYSKPGKHWKMTLTLITRTRTRRLPLYPGPGRGGSRLSRDAQMSLSPDTSSSSSRGAQGVPRPAVPGNASRGRCPVGIRYRCPSHLNWLLSTWRSSSSTPSPLRMAELFTLSLRECPATLRRKLISAACIRDLVLSVMTQSSWP